MLVNCLSLNNYSTYDDEALIPLLQKADARAFDEIYNRYWKRMLALAYVQLKQYEEAEDVVHDIFTSLWQRRSNINITSLEHWLAAAVKYKVVNLLNRRLRRMFSIEKFPESVAIDPVPDSRFLQQQVDAAIERLPEKCRLVFRNSHQHGFSNKEIAKELGLTEKTVEKHLSNARRHLSFSLKNLMQFFFSILF